MAVGFFGLQIPNNVEFMYFSSFSNKTEDQRGVQQIAFHKISKIIDAVSLSVA